MVPRYLLSLVMLACALALAVPLDAQAPAAATHYAVTYLDVMPSGRTAMMAAFRRYRDASRTQNGYQGFELFEQAGPPAHFVLVETWADQAAFDAHAMAAHTRTYRDAVEAIRVSGYDQRPYKPLAVAPPAGAAGGQAVHVVAHVDIGGQQANVPGLLARHADESRKDAGCVRFVVLQHLMRANHFTVIETWTNQAALDAHAAAMHTRQYREALTPITGSPVDERVFKMVE